MKCNNCGYYNKTNEHYCEKCGSPLDKNSYNNPVRKYKDVAKTPKDSSFSTTQKIIIAIAIVAVLMLVLSAVIPSDFQIPNMAGQDNNTVEEPITNDTQVEKLNTDIKVGSIANNGENIIVNAVVTDSNGYAVNSGTTSITVNDVKYSGQVKTGNVDVYLPETTIGTTVTIVYEGNDEYNPSQTTAQIEVEKINTEIETQIQDNALVIMLKTENNNPINDSVIKVTYPDGTQLEQQTDANGKTSINIEGYTEDTQIKLSYPGSSMYNPCEKTVNLHFNKTDTKLDAQYDQTKEAINIKLTDSANNPIPDAMLIITDNADDKQEKTNAEGTVEMPLTEKGQHNISIKYDGNDTYNSANTSITVIISDGNDTNTTNTTNTTDNNTNNTVNTSSNTVNTTVNDTNTTVNDTQNATTDNNTQILKDDVSYNDTGNNTTTDDTKINTNFETQINKENSSVKIELTTADHEKLYGQYVEIKLDNGTQIKQKTDENGTITLDVDPDSNVKQIELIYQGDEKYSSARNVIRY